MTKRAKSSRTGTLPCVRVISGASRLAARPAVVAAVEVRLEARLLLPALLQVEAHLRPRGGGAGGRGAAAPPIVLSRNGRKLNVNGNTTVRAGTEIKAETEQSPMNIGVSELDSGSWVIFELPGFATANAGTPQNSLDALRNATATSYYKGDGSLWVKLVSAGVTGNGGRGVAPGNSIQVSR